jgi:hypothetical protein
VVVLIVTHVLPSNVDMLDHLAGQAEKRRLRLRVVVLSYLEPEQFRVAAVVAHQVRVGAVFEDPTLVQDIDPVGAAHRGQPVRHEDDAASVAGEVADPVEYLDLGARVERGGRLVEDDHHRVAVVCAGQADALPLPA